MKDNGGEQEQPHARAYVDDLMNEASDLGEFAVIADRDGSSGKAKTSTMRIGATMEFFSSQRA
jgi:hypothetical protein